MLPDVPEHDYTHSNRGSCGLCTRACSHSLPRCSKPSDLELRGFLDESRNERDPFLDGGTLTHPWPSTQALNSLVEDAHTPHAPHQSLNAGNSALPAVEKDDMYLTFEACAFKANEADPLTPDPPFVQML